MSNASLTPANIGPVSAAHRPRTRTPWDSAPCVRSTVGAYARFQQLICCDCHGDKDGDQGCNGGDPVLA